MSMPVVLRTDAELNMGASWPAQPGFRLVTAEDDRPETLIRLAPQADVIFTCYAPITADVIEAASQLRGIAKYGVGVDSIDIDTATRLGIPVVHCPNYGTETVADHAFALLLTVARNITLVDGATRTEGWLWPEPQYCGVDLAGKTLGLVGFGRIGRAMARRGAGFGMRRLVCDPYVSTEAADGTDIEFASLDTVIDEADFLSLHCVLTPETKHLIGRAEFRRMKRSAILVNVSRGQLVHEGAMVDVLEAGDIAGAGLDVFDREPLESSHRLHRLTNVVLTPHFAFYTKEAYLRLEKQCLEAVRQILRGEMPPNMKNASELGQLTKTTTSRRAEHVSALDWQTTEGDINLSGRRAQWQAQQLDTETMTVLDRDAVAFLHQSLSTPCLNALERCEGSYLVDRQGRRYIDFHGNSVHQVGYGHPHVLSAVRKQLEVLPFCPRRFTNEPAIQLAERLGQLAPGRLNKVLFTPSGTGAIGIALKLARYATGSHKTISMWDSFHGASLDAISIGGQALFRDGLGPLLPGSFHVPWPQTVDDAHAVEQIMIKERDIGAVIAEPMRCTTVERPPDAYWRRIRELCDRHGALLIFDEIPLALGRTGRMFCCEHTGVVPDILVIGKGLGGGVIPMAAIIARHDLDIAGDRALGHYTHEKSPVGAAAGLAVLEVIERDGLLDRSRQLGDLALQRLQKVQQRQASIADLRVLGLAIAIELATSDQNGGLDADQVLYECLTRGMSFKVSAGNVLTLMPPLTISSDQICEAIDIVEEALTICRNIAAV